MQAVLTPRQMAAADRATIDAGTPSLLLMERAGQAVARAAAALAGGCYGRRMLILCGKGNNAGDGLVAARLLAGWGALPMVVYLDDPSALVGDAATNQDRLGPLRTQGFEVAGFGRELARADVVIDALVGTGFKGSLVSPFADAVEAVNASGVPVLAVDIPSGVDGATGRVGGPAIRAAATVTMAALKLGLVLAPGSWHAGRVEVADIGIATPLPGPDVAGVPGATGVAAVLGRRPPEAHKKSVGTVMIVGGSAHMPGAVALATRAALRAGAGLATLASVASVAQEVHGAILESTMLELPRGPLGGIGAGSGGLILERAAGVEAVAVGPGLATEPQTVEVVHEVVRRLAKPVVLDADGLNAVAIDPSVLASRGAPTVLTPHPGELSRLLGTSTADIQSDRLGAARTAARRFNSAVVLKGHRSIVADADGRTAVITTGGPGLATGGTGDVLTGITVTLLAGGASPFDAAWAAAWLHGAAGDRLEERVGVRGLLAGDLPDMVAEVMRDLEGLL